MKRSIWMVISLLLLSFMDGGCAQEVGNSHDLVVSVDRQGSRYHIKGSFITLNTTCEAFRYLIDYEGIKNMPGIVASKVVKREGNRVTVERVIEERILLIPIEFKSTIEYTELPNQGLNFIQTRGDNKSYSGTWRLHPQEKGVQIKYDSVVELHTLIPNMVIEYFIQNSIEQRFEFMADRMEKNRDSLNLACR